MSCCALFIFQTQSLANEPIKKIISPSGAKSFEFVARELGGKTVYKKVNIPYTSQPVYVNFINRRLNDSGDSIEASLFEDETLTKALGSLIINFDGSKLRSVFKIPDGKEVDFNPGFYQGRCKKSENYTAIHPVEEVKNDLGRLGEGPWGKQAWVKAKFIELSRLDLDYRFNGERFSHMRIGLDSVVEFQSYNSDLENYSTYRMPVEKLLLSNDYNIDFEIGCEKDFKINSQLEPMVVNLAPPNFGQYDPNDRPFEMTDADVKEVSACMLIKQKPASRHSPQQLSVSLEQPVDAVFLAYSDLNKIIYPTKETDLLYDFPSIRTASSPVIFVVKRDQGLKVSVTRSKVLEPKKRERHTSLNNFEPNEKVLKAKEELTKAEENKKKLLDNMPKTLEEGVKFRAEIKVANKHHRESLLNYLTAKKEQSEEKVAKRREEREAEKIDRSTIEIKTPPKYIKHKFSDSTLRANSAIKIFVSNFELVQIIPGQSIFIDFAPGEYPLKIRTINLNDESTEEYFNLVVTEDPKQPEKIVDLSKVSSKKLYPLEQEERTRHLVSVWNNVIVKSVEKVSFVSDTVIDLSPFFHPHSIFAQKPHELDAFLDQLGSGSIVVEGKCHDTEPKSSFHSITIHSSPSDKSSTLGALKLKHKKRESDIEISFVRPDGFVTGFKPNYLNQACENTSSILVLHQIAKSQGEWSDLGPGVWGESGWIKVTARPLFNNDFVFEVPGIGYGKLKKKTNETYIFTPEDSEGSVGDKKTKNVNRMNLIRNNGEIITQVVCQLGC